MAFGMIVIVGTDEKFEAAVVGEALKIAVELGRGDLLGSDHQRPARCSVSINMHR